MSYGMSQSSINFDNEFCTTVCLRTKTATLAAEVAVINSKLAQVVMNSVPQDMEHSSISLVSTYAIVDIKYRLLS